MIVELEKEMETGCKDLEFERAAALRDQIYELRAILAEIQPAAVAKSPSAGW